MGGGGDEGRGGRARGRAWGGLANRWLDEGARGGRGLQRYGPRGRKRLHGLILVRCMYVFKKTSMTT